MNKWSRRVESWSRKEIDIAINDDKWQAFRRSLKGLPTRDKLESLSDYLNVELDQGMSIDVDKQIRVDNYINALKRGGQLDINCNVVR